MTSAKLAEKILEMLGKGKSVDEIKHVCMTEILASDAKTRKDTRPKTIKAVLDAMRRQNKANHVESTWGAKYLTMEMVSPVVDPKWQGYSFITNTHFLIVDKTEKFGGLTDDYYWDKQADKDTKYEPVNGARPIPTRTPVGSSIVSRKLIKYWKAMGKAVEGLESYERFYVPLKFTDGRVLYFSGTYLTWCLDYYRAQELVLLDYDKQYIAYTQVGDSHCVLCAVAIDRENCKMSNALRKYVHVMKESAGKEEV